MLRNVAFPGGAALMCFAFFYVTDLEAAGEIIGRYGGVQDLLSALRAFPDNKDIASNCCGALWSLAVSGMMSSLFLHPKGLRK